MEFSSTREKTMKLPTNLLGCWSISWLPSHELNITSFLVVIEDFSLVNSMKE